MALEEGQWQPAKVALGLSSRQRMYHDGGWRALEHAEMSGNQIHAMANSHRSRGEFSRHEHFTLNHVLREELWAARHS